MNHDLKSATSLTVEDIMTTDVHVVALTMTIREAIDVLIGHKVSGAPVVDTTGKAISVVSEGDLLKLAANHGLDKKLSSCLDKLVTPEKLITAKRSDLFTHVYRLFLTHPVHRIVIIDGNGNLQGIVSRSNILRNFVLEKDAKG